MRLTAKVYDALGRKLGEGPLWMLTGATITRALDGAGSVTISAPGNEERANDLLTNERRVRVYGQQGDDARRELGRGIVRDVRVRVAESGWEMSADGPDTLDELKRRSTWLARIYKGAMGDIVRDLGALAGWTTTVDAAYADKLLAVRFDGVSVLKAMQEIAKGQGLHLREGVGERLIEVGRFGTPTGIQIINVAYAPAELHDNPDVMLIESMTVTRNSEQVTNWLMPVGGGQGESAITLEHSTRTGPYPIVPIVDGDKTSYAMVDAVSEARYGRIDRVAAFKDVVPISNSDADLELAANALYDAAAAWLGRNAERIDTYRVSVVKVGRTIRPGDTVRLKYRGFIENDQGVVVNYADVDADFWVIRAVERVGLEGISLDLDISTADQVVQDAATVIVGAMESIQMAGLRVQPYPSQSSYVYRKEIDATHTAVVPIDITNAVLYLNQCRLLMKTRPYRVTAKAAASGEVTTTAGGASTQTSNAGGGSTESSSSGGNHSHRIGFVAASGFGDPASFGYSYRSVTFRSADAGPPFNLVTWANNGADLWTYDSAGSHSHSVNIPAHTHTINIPAHTHTVPSLLIDFGINDDTQYPSGVRVMVDGQDVTAALGGPWAPTGGELDQVVDITDYLVNAAGGLQQRHTVTLACDGGQGEIEVTVEMRTTVQSIAVV